MKVIRFLGRSAVLGLSMLGLTFAVAEVLVAGTWYLPLLATGFGSTVLLARGRAAAATALRLGPATTAVVVAVLGGASLQLFMASLGCGIVAAALQSVYRAHRAGARSPKVVGSLLRPLVHFRSGLGAGHVRQ